MYIPEAGVEGPPIWTEAVFSLALSLTPIPCITIATYTHNTHTTHTHTQYTDKRLICSVMQQLILMCQDSLFRYLQPHPQHLFNESLSITAHGTAEEGHSTQPRLLLQTAPVKTSFASRTDQYFKPALTDRRETQATVVCLETSCLDELQTLERSVDGAESLESAVMLEQKPILHSAGGVAHLSARLHHAAGCCSFSVTEPARLTVEKTSNILETHIATLASLVRVFLTCIVTSLAALLDSLRMSGSRKPFIPSFSSPRWYKPAAKYCTI